MRRIWIAAIVPSARPMFHPHKGYTLPSSAKRIAVALSKCSSDTQFLTLRSDARRLSCSTNGHVTDCGVFCCLGSHGNGPIVLSRRSRRRRLVSAGMAGFFCFLRSLSSRSLLSPLHLIKQKPVLAVHPHALATVRRNRSSERPLKRMP